MAGRKRFDPKRALRAAVGIFWISGYETLDELTANADESPLLDGNALVVAGRANPLTATA